MVDPPPGARGDGAQGRRGDRRRRRLPGVAQLAADAIDEWLERIAAESSADSSPLDAGQTLHLHATDDGLRTAGEWTITGTDAGIAWSHEHGKGDAALRGSAKDLLLAVVRRRTAAEGGLEIFGDTAIWDGWLGRTPF